MTWFGKKKPPEPPTPRCRTTVGRNGLETTCDRPSPNFAATCDLHARFCYGAAQFPREAAEDPCPTCHGTGWVPPAGGALAAELRSRAR